jgi:hypothetical protein
MVKMAWYEHQPFYWILNNLTTRQIVNLIVGLFFIFVILGSYYVYLDTAQYIKYNPLYLWVFRNVSILILMVIIFLFLLSMEVKEKFGI